MNQENQLWVGLVDAEQPQGVKYLGEAKGGFVKVVAQAINYPEFVDRIRVALEELDLRLVEVDDVKPWSELDSKERSDELRQMARTAAKIDSVTFGTFYLYDND